VAAKSAETNRIEYLSAYNALCGKDGCLTRDTREANELTTFDTAHLTLAGSVYLMSKLLPDILAKAPAANP
jgi:hypothetical protein